MTSNQLLVHLIGGWLVGSVLGGLVLLLQIT